MDRDWLKEFVKVAPPIDEVREEAARCADETARMESGERGPLRYAHGLVSGEFSDAAFGYAAEVAQAAMEALRATGKRCPAHLYWSAAARLLRAGWRRGTQIDAVRIGRGKPS